MLRSTFCIKRRQAWQSGRPLKERLRMLGRMLVVTTPNGGRRSDMQLPSMGRFPSCLSDALDSDMATNVLRGTISHHQDSTASTYQLW